MGDRRFELLTSSLSGMRIFVEGHDTPPPLWSRTFEPNPSCRAVLEALIAGRFGGFIAYHPKCPPAAVIARRSLRSEPLCWLRRRHGRRSVRPPPCLSPARWHWRWVCERLRYPTEAAAAAVCPEKPPRPFPVTCETRGRPGPWVIVERGVRGRQASGGSVERA
jgi:hypothetical protein